MSGRISLLRELAGLFVDDGSLALAILCIVALAALLAFLIPSLSLVGGAILLFGSLAILLTNVVRTAQNKRAR
jgi:hypothetical protein